MTPVPYSKWISEGFHLYKNNFFVVFVATLLTLVISIVSLGILSGAMIGGLFYILLRLIDRAEPKPGIEDVFKRFDKFLPTFLFVLIVFVVNVVGQWILGKLPLGGILSYLYAAILTACTMFGLPLIVDRNLNTGDALSTSFKKAKSNLLHFAIFAFIVQVLGSIGLLLFGVGVFLTLPISICCIAVAYRDVFSQGAAAPVEPATVDPTTTV